MKPFSWANWNIFRVIYNPRQSITHNLNWLILFSHAVRFTRVLIPLINAHCKFLAPSAREREWVLLYNMPVHLCRYSQHTRKKYMYTYLSMKLKRSKSIAQLMPKQIFLITISMSNCSLVVKSASQVDKIRVIFVKNCAK